MAVPPITYNGDGTFQDKYEPVPGKSEWGMDTLTRGMQGAQPNLKLFVAGLAQGQTFAFNFNTYYLQTWECDNNQVFPTVTMVYKGLFDGIPAPFTTGRTCEQTSSQTTSSAISITYFDFTTQGSVTKDVMGTRNTRYITREANWKYITIGRPSSPTYTTLDVSFTPQAIQSEITTDAGVTFASNAPSALATALAPAIGNITTTECTPVVGSPYFECTDNVMQYWS